ncbi:hypothetical protein GGR56DRAFT_688322 [Xylariaceae sp. FL0804]|nr:hypothetical protein GGR56DRAFT_688322 [Xylariaceae sp. FL0804]
MGDAPPESSSTNGHDANANAHANANGIRNDKDLTGHTLLLLVPWDPPAGSVERLRARFPGLAVRHVRHDSWKRQGLPAGVDWAPVTALLTGGEFPEPDQAPELRLVQLQSAGANQLLELPLFTDSKIPFCTANGIHGPQIAEWVICTFLAYQRSLPRFLDSMKKGKWDRDWNGTDTVGQRVGILGYGSIGRQIARVATAMGMEVFAYTNRPRTTPEERRDHAWCEPGLGDPEGALPARWFAGDLDGFLASGLDLLVVSVPLTPQTRGMLAAPQFRLLRERRAYVSNIGRGPVIDTDGLMKALDEGWIRGAALDVTDPEPLPEDHPLWHKPDVIVTPHVSGNSTNYNPRLMKVLEANLASLAEGKPFLNRVSRERGY